MSTVDVPIVSWVSIHRSIHRANVAKSLDSGSQTVVGIRPLGRFTNTQITGLYHSISASAGWEK